MARVDLAEGLDGEVASHAALHLHPDVLVVGGGVAGLAAAAAAASSGLETVLIEADHQVGGWVALGSERALVDELLSQALAAGVVVLTNSVVTARTSDGLILAVLERAGGDELALIHAGHVIAACGLVERTLTFEGNDLPGVMLSTGARRLLRHWSVRPGERAVVLASGGDGALLADELGASGAAVVEVLDGRSDTMRRALGSSRQVEAVELGDRRRVDADVVVLAPGWTIDAGLVTSLGAEIRTVGGRPSAVGRPDIASVVGSLGGDGELDEVVAHAQIVGRQAAAGAARAARGATSHPGAGRRAAPPAPTLEPSSPQPRSFALANGVIDLVEDLTSPQLD